MLLKLIVLPWLQLGCAKAVGLPVPAAMSLVVLSICPVSATSFVVSSQYQYGVDVSVRGGDMQGRGQEAASNQCQCVVSRVWILG